MQITSHVYFVQQERDGPIKIGLAKNVVHRLDALRASNPSELHVLAVVPGDVALESELHGRFAKHHIRGEWFRPDAAIVEYIASLPVAVLRDLRLRRKYSKGRVPMDEARKIWADPELTSRHARSLLKGWTDRRIAAELGRRPVNHQGRNSAENGKLGGKPEADFEPKQWEAAYNVWHNRKAFPTWNDVDAALATIVSPNGQKFTRYRAHAKWGGRT